MSDRMTGQHLLVFLRPRLTMALVRDDPEGKLTLGSQKFRSKAEGSIEGFYDWLRSGSGEIVGVRYTPTSDSRELPHFVDGLSYAEVSPDATSFTIFFAPSRQFDETKSADQAFAPGGLYEADDDGGYALCFDTYSLSTNELRSVQRAAAEWVTPL